MFAIDEMTKSIIDEVIIVLGFSDAAGNGSQFNICDTYLCKSNC